MSTLIASCLLGLLPVSDVPSDAVDGPAVALVEQLSSEVWRERRKAERELVALGAAAVPVLEAALANGTDPETAACIESALARIEEESKQGATRVTLAFNNAELPDVLATLSEQTGMTIGLHPPDLAEKQNLPRITADYAGLPLWEVMRDLREQTHLYLRPGKNDVLLCNRAWQAVASGPSEVSGPFLIELREIRRERAVTFDAVRIADHAANDVRGKFGIGLTIHAEPKLALAHEGLSVTLDRAEDDRGNDLRTRLRPRSKTSTTGGVAVTIGLDHPDMGRLGERITELAGIIHADALDQWRTIEADLAGDTDTTLGNGWSATVAPANPFGGRRFGLSLSVTVPETSRMAAEDLFRRVKVTDSTGRAMRLRDIRHERADRPGDRHRYTFSAIAEGSINPRRDDPVVPASLHWEIPTQRQTVEADFAFRDLPIP
ncbi:MAG: hypothetical protein AAGD32_18020 [Planctomycetota bacterium]